MDLTKSSDRLPAIAGVASKFGEILNSKYLAGLWQIALPADLLWRTDHTIESGQHGSDYRAPSWSWASIDGKIKHYKMRSYRPDFLFIGAHCNPATDINPFGEVTNGWLKIYARIASLSFTLDLSEDTAQSRRRLKVHFLGGSAIFFPDYDISVGSAAKHARTHTPHSMEYKFLCVGEFNVERDSASASETRGGGVSVVSLVIQQVDGGMYQRVGVLEHNRGMQVKPMYEMHVIHILTLHTHIQALRTCQTAGV
jgi:hypothetical protein